MNSSHTRWRRLIPGLILAGVAVLVAACTDMAGGERLVRGYWETYGPTKVIYAKSTGPVPVIVRGDPFGEGEAFAGGLVERLQGKPFWAPAGRYVASVSPGESAYWLVFVFDPPHDYDGYDACAGRNAPASGASAAAATTVVAAFCSSVKLESEVRGSVAGVSRSGDPSFGRFWARLINELLPYRPGYLGPGVLTN